jgi:peptidyl-prolyl cis-trans isomerase SurA
MRRLFRPIAIALALLVLAPATGALAVTIQVVVNGVPITSYDIDQRVALQQISGQTPNRTTATNELIDELVQLGEAIRLGVPISSARVDAAYASIAAQVGMGVSQFDAALRQSGVDPESLKRRLQAQIAWSSLMQARIQMNAAVRQQDVTDAMLAAGRQTETIREYRLQQIVFVVPAGSSSAFVTQRRNEAEAFRQRFTGCDNTLALAQPLRDVVVLDIGRDLSRLTGTQAEAVEGTAAGRTTRPEQTGRGIEIIAVCAVADVAGNEAARNQIQNQLLIERGEEIGLEYLAELRARAIIIRM